MELHQMVELPGLSQRRQTVACAIAHRLEDGWIQVEYTLQLTTTSFKVSVEWHLRLHVPSEAAYQPFSHVMHVVVAKVESQVQVVQWAAHAINTSQRTTVNYLT